MGGEIWNGSYNYLLWNGGGLVVSKIDSKGNIEKVYLKSTFIVNILINFVLSHLSAHDQIYVLIVESVVPHRVFIK